MAGTVAIVGAGQIGYAAYRAFAKAGWHARVLARSRPAWLDEQSDDFQTYTLGEADAPAADVVVDTIAFDAQDIARYSTGAVGRLIAVSSASVYSDHEGRTLDEAAQNGFPDFGSPIAERQSTVEAGPETYSTRKIRMEQAATAAFGERATLLRPCAIHGPHSRHPREWWFVKRLLDGRDRIPLAHKGASQFQTTSARMIGEFAVHAAEKALGGPFNLADASAPSVAKIGSAITKLMGREAEFVTDLGANAQPLLGRTPWSVPLPFIIDGAKARTAGFNSAASYTADIGLALDTLRKMPSEGWEERFPQLAAYPWDLFDYAAEDAYFAQL